MHRSAEVEPADAIAESCPAPECPGRGTGWIEPGSAATVVPLAKSEP